MVCFCFPGINKAEIKLRKGNCRRIEKDVRHMKMNPVISGGGWCVCAFHVRSVALALTSAVQMVQNVQTRCCQSFTHLTRK